jgi:hypothetical protein
MNCSFRVSRLIVFVIMLSLMNGCAMQSTLRPVTDPTMRYTGNGYSALPPQGKDWYISYHGSNAVNFGKPPADKYHTFAATIMVMMPEAKKVDSSVEFPKAIEHLMTETLGGDGSRFRLISLNVAPFGPQGSYCSQYDFVQEERHNPGAPGVVLEITAHGFVCLDASSEFMVRADYSERKIKETESMLDDALKQEAEGFLKDVILTPLRDS